MQEFNVYLRSYLSARSVLEILLLTFMFYQLLKWIKGTQAEQVVKGLIILMVLMPISTIFGFTTVTFLIQSLFTWIFLLIIVVFRPELRTVLEQIGNNKLFNRLTTMNTEIKNESKSIESLTTAVRDLARDKTGALIVCEGRTGLMDIASDQERGAAIINADITPRLIMNLFFKNSPLHDGAVIVSLRENKVIAAGCVLPLSTKKNLPHHFGTRHRAGMGISEHSDAVTIIVSEETGHITLTHNGYYDYDVTVEQMHDYLEEEYIEPLEVKEDYLSKFPRMKKAYNKVFKKSSNER